MGRKKTGQYIICLNCGKSKYVPAYRIKENVKYCSLKCFHEKRTPWNKGKIKSNDKRLMSISNKSREQMKREYENGIRDKFEITKKANEICRKKGLERFNNNPNRIISKRGYYEIYVPCKGWTKEHHYVWLKAGKKIPKEYHLHHINGNKLDNRIENLKLITNSEHGKLHYNKHKIDKSGRFIKKQD